MTRAARLAVLGLLALQAGCYTYEPVRSAPEGTAVRARITAAEAERLASVLGREDRVLLGRIAGEENGGLLLQVRSVSGSAERLYQRVTIPRDALVELELRQLDPLRTGGLAAGIAAVAVYAYTQFQSDTAAEPGTEPPPTTEIRIPIRLPF